MKTKSVSTDPRPPVANPDPNTQGIRPPMKRKKRKTRSDKGKKRSTMPVTNTDTPKQESATISREIKDIRKRLKMFDECVKSANWKMQVWPCFSNTDKYEIYFWFNGVKYGYKQTFDDASVAVTIGTQYLEHRYKNKSMYQENNS